MKRFDRRAFIKATGLAGTAGLAGLAGCTGGPSGGDTGTTDGTGDSAGTTTEDTTEESATTTEERTETSAAARTTGEGTAEPMGTTDSTGMTDPAETTAETGGSVDGTTGTAAETGGTDDATGTTGGGATSSGTVHVGMVYATGGLGDGSFNDQAQQGIQQAAEELDVEYDEAQPDEASQFSNFQQQFASSTDPNYELVSCIGFLQADALSETAPNYPEQSFQIIDAVVDADNVASYRFREHEGSFLAGVLASMLTTRSFSAGAGSTQPDTTSVGFVGGRESDLIGRFEAGFKSGVTYTDENVDVQTAYVGSFNDPSGGQTAATQMYSSGADIVYHAAGNTGTGVFQAAQEQGRFAIGVDRDQSRTRPDYQDVILASMVKRVDTAVYNAVEATVNDSFPGGTTTTLGLSEGGVEVVYGQQLGSAIPQGVKTAVSEARQGIIDGEIDVPTDPSNV